MEAVRGRLFEQQEIAGAKYEKERDNTQETYDFALLAGGCQTTHLKKETVFKNQHLGALKRSRKCFFCTDHVLWKEAGI